MEKFPMTFMYDMQKKQIGCALIQATFGCTIDNFNLQKTGVENWFLAPTEGMKKYNVKSQEEFDKVVEITKANVRKKKT